MKALKIPWLSCSCLWRVVWEEITKLSCNTVASSGSFPISLYLFHSGVQHKKLDIVTLKMQKAEFRLNLLKFKPRIKRFYNIGCSERRLIVH
jgi:hypothetical protein